MPDYSSILNQVQIEVTTYCNAHCPGCGRNEKGAEITPNLNLEHMDIAVWNKLISEDFFYRKFTTITLNGMFGDPMMHPMIYEMIDQVPRDFIIEINTNGSMRNKVFWSRFSELLCEFEDHRLIWGIDGLQDTNHLHRRGTVWQNIMDNLTAFNQRGGISEWRMTVFEHNKHQILDCKKLSEDLGCSNFTTRESYEPYMEAKAYKDMPSQVYHRVTKQEIAKILDDFSTDELNKPEPSDLYLCPWLSDKSIQISADGKVWPCCYTSEEPYHKNRYDEIWTFPNIPNDLKTYTLQQILESEFYTSYIDKIWLGKKSRICNECIYGNPEGED